MAIITYREMNRDEIKLLREIDRREAIDGIYYCRDGKLVLENEHHDVKGFWPPELERLIEKHDDLVNRGGTVYGAFDGERLAGMGSLECAFIGSAHTTLQMPMLYVDRACRKLGVGAELVKLIKAKAVALGAQKLYISATPSRNTVDFYLRQGCVLASEIDQELLKLEPYDIHLELPLG
ncbi:MAG: GNAT family N-acetyltransferase [Bacillota bacterium]